MTRKQIALMAPECRRAELAAIHAEMFKDHLSGFRNAYIACQYKRPIRYAQFVIAMLYMAIPGADSTDGFVRINYWVSRHTEPLIRLMEQEHMEIMTRKLPILPVGIWGKSVGWNIPLWTRGWGPGRRGADRRWCPSSFVDDAWRCCRAWIVLISAEFACDLRHNEIGHMAIECGVGRGGWGWARTSW